MKRSMVVEGDDIKGNARPLFAPRPVLPDLKEENSAYICYDAARLNPGPLSACGKAFIICLLRRAKKKWEYAFCKRAVM